MPSPQEYPELIRTRLYFCVNYLHVTAHWNNDVEDDYLYVGGADRVNSQT